MVNRGRWLVVVCLAAGCAGRVEPSAIDEGQALTPKLEIAADGVGTAATWSTNRFDAGSTNAFFTPLGKNGRSCNSCHRQENGWTISAATVQGLAADDPLFAPVDGSDCPPLDPSEGPNAAVSTMLTRYGLIRIQIAVPAGADFTVADATNPEGCAIPPGDPSIQGQLFLFRRPLPTASLFALSTVMWDGRETLHAITTGAPFKNTGPILFDLDDQDVGAALGHEQGPSIAGTQTLADSVTFETNLFAAQLAVGAQALDKDGAHGGPKTLSQDARKFSIGENDPLAPGFDPKVFTIYAAWEPGASAKKLTPDEQAIGRGEKLFNERTFSIVNVAGLNSASNDPLANDKDPLFNQPLVGTCSTCHNSFEIGDHSTSLPLNIGVTDVVPTDNDGQPITGILDLARLPVYTLERTAGGTIEVTDPARALISGHFVDAGKTKGPILRGLASRAPYFHNGSAKDLPTVVDFYDARFQIGFTEGEKQDLVAFLQAL